MKFFISVLLLLSSFTSFASREINIELSAEQGVELRRYKYAEAEYRAANPTCQEIIETHVMPLPIRRTKTGTIDLEKNSISAKSGLGGFCNYKLSSMTALLVRGNESTILGFYPEANAATEIDLVCTRTGKILCYERGNPTLNPRLAVSSTETTRIFITLE